MIVLPWYIRFGIDCVLIATPLLYLHSKSLIMKIIRQLIYYKAMQIKGVSYVEEV